MVNNNYNLKQKKTQKKNDILDTKHTLRPPRTEEHYKLEGEQKTNK